MLEKIKDGIKWVGIPVLLVAGWLFYLLNRVSGLKSTIAVKDAERELAPTLDKLEGERKNAEAKEADFDGSYADYLAKRDEYIRKSGKLPD